MHAGTPDDPSRERMRRRLEAGRIWEPGTEWNAVRALLAHEAVTEMGRERATMAEPLTDLSEVQAAIEMTRQARLALATAGSLPLEALPDIRPVLTRCAADGSVLDGPELIQIIPLLEASPKLRAYGKAVREMSPGVAAITDGLPRFAELAERLHRALDASGAVTDDASPTLKRLRREIRDRRRQLAAELERAFQGGDTDRLFTDRYVTLRHGRYVLPVRAEARGRVRGIVHDRSQSGQTLFIEPEHVVDANNDLVQTTREEEHETARILAELTAGVRARLVDLEALVASVGELDWTFARGQAAERMGATAPVIDGARTVALRGACHPLLLAQRWKDPSRTVVPMDLELGPDRPLLVITGPNAGGKTIALKTLAVLALMAQVGCHLPAAEGARLPVFDDVFAIIGDDQSVAENLSTFSAFVKQAREILDAADERSLVLLDELGAGTDPDEGAALAQAILEALAERGALVIATTHLEPLKAFASTHPRARNASVEFDTATLAPTFRLRYDQPGQSYALTIAARLGLGAELIARAHAHRSEHAARISDLLATLDAHARSDAERAHEIERTRAEAAAQLAKARQTEAAAESRAQAIVARARAEATTLVGEIRRALTAEWDKLKRSERSRRSLDESRRRVREAAVRIEAIAPDPSSERPEALAPGASVAAEHLGIRGELLEIAGSSATVRSGSVTVRVPVSALRLAPANPTATGRGEAGSGGRGPARVGFRSAGPFPASPRPVASEILLLGQTTDEARDRVEKYLDDAFLAGLASVRLVHGKGSGALRKTVRDLLAGHPLVESFRDGEPSEGGTGATVAALKVG
ncbi:MAG: endonuclease MutS2 [Candidatus Rokuibacteriota bacterium]|nr:MAG: endonuclease MutS2 [Candidatus Rokubacteria bacterium]